MCVPVDRGTDRPTDRLCVATGTERNYAATDRKPGALRRRRSSANSHTHKHNPPFSQGCRDDEWLATTALLLLLHRHHEIGQGTDGNGRFDLSAHCMVGGAGIRRGGHPPTSPYFSADTRRFLSHQGLVFCVVAFLGKIHVYRMNISFDLFSARFRTHIHTRTHTRFKGPFRPLPSLSLCTPLSFCYVRSFCFLYSFGRCPP